MQVVVWLAWLMMRSGDERPASRAALRDPQSHPAIVSVQ
jgi:hypothetical protein